MPNTRKPKYSIDQVLGGFKVVDKITAGPYVLECSRCGKHVKHSHTSVQNNIETGKQKYCGECNRKLKKQSKKYKANLIYISYKSEAKTRGYKFALSKKDFENLIFEECAYCAAPPSNCKIKANTAVHYNGLDRIDNDKGYTKDNVVPCCRQCNIAKHSHSQEEFFT